MSIAEQVGEYMNEHGIKKNIIAQKIGVSSSVFSSMINGHRKMSAEEYFAICDALNVSVAYFRKET